MPNLLYIRKDYKFMIKNYKKDDILKELKKISHKYGVEIDIRTNGSKIILNHEPLEEGDKLVDYIENYRHGTLILNIKETEI